MGDRARGLDATQLKYLACGAMVIDHIGMLFSPMAAVAGPGDLLFYLFRYVGRLAFPIFAYFTAEGCRKTGNSRRYLLRLGLFGAFTHIVAFGATGGQSGSVIATFFLSALGIWFYRLLRERGLPAVPALLPALALAVFGQLAHVDYGSAGVCAVTALYLCGEHPRRKLLCLSAAMAATYLIHYPLEIFFQYEMWLGFHTYLPWLRSFFLPFSLLYTLCSWTALPLLSLYNGQRGSGSRWFFYWFYPLHMAVLYGLSTLIP